MKGGCFVDKKKEEEILTNIFSKNDYTINSTEEPDFILLKNDTKEVFGVEVTEIFLTESDARLLYIPGYFSNIIDGDKYRNKIDRKVLPVKNATVYSAGIKDNPKDIKCIIRSVPSRDEVAKIIREAINKKNMKINNYKRKTAKNNLIISDNEHFIKSKSDLYSSAFNFELVQTIIVSEFEKIYLITYVGSEMLFYELKSACFIFLAFLTLAFVNCFKLDNPQKYHFTLDLLSSIGFKLTSYYSEKEDCIKVKCWNAIVCFVEKNEELLIDRIFTNEDVGIEDNFQEFPSSTYDFGDIKDKYLEFLHSKDLIVDLSKKVT